MQKPQTGKKTLTEFLNDALPSESRVEFVKVSKSNIVGQFDKSYLDGAMFYTKGDIEPFKKEIQAKGIELTEIPKGQILDIPKQARKIKFFEFLKTALPKYDSENSFVQWIDIKGDEIKVKLKIPIVLTIM